MSRPVIGIDFGTSTTLVASVNGIVPIGVTSAWMPSVAGYDDGGTVLIGESAVDLPERRSVRSVKRWITEERSSVQISTPYGVEEHRADDIIVELLREAARRATAQGLDLASVRLGCPAMWDGRQHRRLVAAAVRAGLPVTAASLVDEPVAAGIAWLARHKGNRALRAVVFDMGGGTLDIAVLDIRGNDLAVLAAVGVPEAGDVLDRAIAEDLEDALAAKGVDVDSLEFPRRARNRLRYAAQEAKVALTTEDEHDVVLPRRLFGIGSVSYTREQLNAAFSAQMDRAEVVVTAALRAARITEPDIAGAPLSEVVEGVDVVVLSGGMSRVPYVAERLRDLFPAGTRIETASARADEAVARGLALASRYRRINRYRPAFDIVLDWDDGQESRAVYEAYTPLVQAGRIGRGGELCYTRTGREIGVPPSGKGRLRLVSHTGGPVQATLGAAGIEDFVAELNGERFAFSVFPDGRLRLADGSGTHEGRIADWGTGR
jgi:molecular chaperone DnaK (HSP70)